MEQLRQAAYAMTDASHALHEVAERLDEEAQWILGAIEDGSSEPQAWSEQTRGSYAKATLSSREQEVEKATVEALRRLREAKSRVPG